MIGAETGPTVRGWLARAGRLLADLVIPPQCLSCRDAVQEPGALCSRCWAGLSLIEEPCCDRLGTPFAYDEGDGAISAAALADPPGTAPAPPPVSTTRLAGLCTRSNTATATRPRC